VSFGQLNESINKDSASNSHPIGFPPHLKKIYISAVGIITSSKNVFNTSKKTSLKPNKK